MAISFTNGISDAGAGSSRTFNATVSAASEIFIVAHTVDDSSTDKNFNGPTYDAAAMTLIANTYDGSTVHRIVGMWQRDVSGSGAETPTIVSDISEQDQHILSGVSIEGTGVVVRGHEIVRGTTAAQTASITIASQPGDTILVALGWDGVSNETDITKSTGQTLITGTDGIASQCGALYQQAASGGSSTTVTFTQSAAGNRQYGIVAIALYEASALTVTDVDTDEIVTNGQTGIVITGTNFEATQGSGTVTIGGVAQTVTAWSDTSITITHVLGTMPYGINSLVVTNNSSDSGNIDVSVQPVPPTTGKSYVTLSTLAAAGQRITAVADLVPGDQLEYDSASTPSGHAITIANDGTFSIAGTPTGESFEVRAWDSTSPSWGSPATQTVSGT